MAQFIRFLFVGVANTSVSIACIFIAMSLFKIDYRIANAIGYLIGFGLSFVLNRTWTFRHHGRWLPSFASWLIVSGIAYMCNFLVIITLHANFGFGDYLAQVGGIIAYTPVSFFGARLIAFRSRQPQLTMELT
jgi:putative flippase GtrA